MMETTSNAGLRQDVAERLHAFGCDVVAADHDVRGNKTQPPGWTLRRLAAVFPGDAILGDNHILVVESLP